MNKILEDVIKDGYDDQTSDVNGTYEVAEEGFLLPRPHRSDSAYYLIAARRDIAALIYETAETEGWQDRTRQLYRHLMSMDYPSLSKWDKDDEDDEDEVSEVEDELDPEDIEQDQTTTQVTDNSKSTQQSLSKHGNEDELIDEEESEISSASASPDEEDLNQASLVEMGFDFKRAIQEMRERALNHGAGEENKIKKLLTELDRLEGSLENEQENLQTTQ